MLIAAVATVAFVACGDKTKKADSSNPSSAATEQVSSAKAEAPEAALPTPSGDAAKDAQAIVDYALAKINACKTEEDLKAYKADWEQIEEAFNKYCEGNADYKKAFEEAGQKVGASIQEALEKKVEEIATSMMGNASAPAEEKK